MNEMIAQLSHKAVGRWLTRTIFAHVRASMNLMPAGYSA